jgi:aminopeptidase N
MQLFIVDHSCRSPVNFHAADGSGYQFMGDAVLRVDKLNHQVNKKSCGILDVMCIILSFSELQRIENLLGTCIMLARTWTKWFLMILVVQVAARMVGAFTSYRQYNSSRQELMRAQLTRIVAENGLSENVLEIANKALAA